jgi:hypothetical protein
MIDRNSLFVMKEIFTAARRFISGRLSDKLRDDRTDGKYLFVGLSPYASLELCTPVLEYNLLFLYEFN